MSTLRRILALALLLTTMSAPLALTLCQVECAHAASDRAAAAHHSCHESGEPAAVSISAVPHFCGHTDEAPAGLERAAQLLLAPAVPVALATWAPPSVIVRGVAAAPQHSPPRSFELLSRLRI
jgi:hypothetical protein